MGDGSTELRPGDNLPSVPAFGLMLAEEVHDSSRLRSIAAGISLTAIICNRVPDGVAGQIPERVAAGAATRRLIDWTSVRQNTLSRVYRGGPARCTHTILRRPVFHSLCSFLYCAKAWFWRTESKSIISLVGRAGPPRAQVSAQLLRPALGADYLRSMKSPPR